MNHLHKYNENKRLLHNYVAFLDECKDYHSRLKLCAEIARLNQQNKAIEKMSFKDAKSKITEYIYYVNAIL